MDPIETVQPVTEKTKVATTTVTKDLKEISPLNKTKIMKSKVLAQGVHFKPASMIVFL